MVKVKMFSHNDLDGVGAPIVAMNVFGKDNVRVEYCGYDVIEKKVFEFIRDKKYEKYDAVFITDISIKSEKLIALVDARLGDKLKLIDHHESATHLNKYEWARVDEYEEEGGRLACGTSMFYDYLIEVGLAKENEELRDFCEQVRSWDTWDWTRVSPRNEVAKQLNSLLNLLGRYRFVSRFAKNPSVFFNKTETDLLDTEQKRVDRYVGKKLSEVVKMPLETLAGKHNVAVVHAGQYVSELGEAINREFPDVDYTIMINGANRLSFRRSDAKDVPMDVVAKTFGGGGHPPAAGATLSKAKQAMIMKFILTPEKE